MKNKFIIKNFRLMGSLTAGALLTIGLADAKEKGSKGSPGHSHNQKKVKENGKVKDDRKKSKGKPNDSGNKGHESKIKPEKPERAAPHNQKDEKLSKRIAKQRNDDRNDELKNIADYKKERQKFDEGRAKQRKDYLKDRAKYEKEYQKLGDKRFSPDDRNEVLEYFSNYRERELGLPPGLAKQYANGKPLPPGWQKKVNRGYVIEDEWDSYFYPLPYDRFPQIERLPNTQLYWYGDRVVQVYEPLREVIDFIIIPTIRFN